MPEHKKKILNLSANDAIQTEIPSKDAMILIQAEDGFWGFPRSQLVSYDAMHNSLEIKFMGHAVEHCRSGPDYREVCAAILHCNDSQWYKASDKDGRPALKIVCARKYKTP